MTVEATVMTAGATVMTAGATVMTAEATAKAGRAAATADRDSTEAGIRVFAAKGNTGHSGGRGFTAENRVTAKTPGGRVKFHRAGV
jgi:hypothetical protein